jgi:pyruvate formate lyase activating enzyme
MTMQLIAPITRIIRGSTVDGPGLRTVVFFKGCPLQCPWCHNPETQHREPELLYDARICIHCGACAGVCDFDAIDISHDYIVDHDNCTACFACCKVCPSNALTPAGLPCSPGELLDELFKDAVYYKTSGGGVTFSGGEPLLYPDFLREVLQCCRDRGIGTCVDSCLAVASDAIESILPYTDLVLADIKHACRPEVHPEMVFDNLSRICGRVRIRIRIPVIPDWNDTPEAMHSILTRCLPFRNAIEQINLLPFHNTAAMKYRYLNRQWLPYEKIPPVPEDRIEQFACLFRKEHFTVTTGG